jgi:hypothetical protein
MMRMIGGPTTSVDALKAKFLTSVLDERNFFMTLCRM